MRMCTTSGASSLAIRSTCSWVGRVVITRHLYPGYTAGATVNRNPADTYRINAPSNIDGPAINFGDWPIGSRLPTLPTCPTVAKQRADLHQQSLADVAEGSRRAQSENLCRA